MNMSQCISASVNDCESGSVELQIALCSEFEQGFFFVWFLTHFIGAKRRCTFTERERSRKPKL